MSADFSFGQSGGELITDTSAHTPTGGVFFAISVVTAATFAVATDGNITGLNDGATAIPAGSIIYGRFNSITLTSGSVVAYLKEEGI